TTPPRATTPSTLITLSRVHSCRSTRNYTIESKAVAFVYSSSTNFRVRAGSSVSKAGQMRFDQIRDEFATIESKIEDGPIVPDVTAGEIRTYLDSRFDFKRAMPLDEVINEVEEMLRTWQVQVTHPRYFGLFNPSVTLASVLAETLVAMYNPQLANWRTSPAGNEIERHTLGWLAAKFGFPADASATFTSGGSEANLSAVVVALTRAFP